MLSPYAPLPMSKQADRIQGRNIPNKIPMPIAQMVKLKRNCGNKFLFFIFKIIPSLFEKSVFKLSLEQILTQLSLFVNKYLSINDKLFYCVCFPQMNAN